MKKIIRKALIYFSSSILNKAIPFLLLPLLTTYLTPAEFGVLAIFQVLIRFGTPLVGMTMSIHITRNFFKVQKEEMARIISNLIILLLFSSSILLLSLFVYSNIFKGESTIPERWLYTIPLMALLGMINTFNLTVLRNRKKALTYGVFEISKTIMDLTLSVLLIAVYAHSWEGRAFGILIATASLGVVSIIYLWKKGYLRLNFDFGKIKEILRISIPLLPHALGIVIINLSDRFFINKMVGAEEVGIYAVGYQFGMMLSLITGAVSLTWSPWLFETLAKQSSTGKLKIVKATYALWGGYLALAFLLTGVAYFLLPFMTAKKFHGGYVYVIWVALGYAFQGMYTLVFPYGIHVGKTSYLGITTFFCALVNLVANYYLIKLNGPLGAAQATLISYILMFVAIWWYSHKLHPMPWFQLLREVKPEK